MVINVFAVKVTSEILLLYFCIAFTTGLIIIVQRLNLKKINLMHPPNTHLYHIALESKKYELSK